jgi:uncharacterized repeat protein (TIGR01451 family)
MQPRSRRFIVSVAVAALVLASGAWTSAWAQTPAARVLVTEPIDARQLVRLAGNTRPEARAANDRGRVPDSMPLPHMLLLLKRPPERELALRHYIQQLHDRRSAFFHHWLTAADFGRRFGVSQQDLAAVSRWLGQHGFTVNAVYPSTLMIDFSGTAGAVREGFHTEIHALSVRGVRHIANMSDPQIPAALAPVVGGVVSLHDFRPRPTLLRGHPAYTLSSTIHLLVPADLATIYNLNPLFSAGTTGDGQTIAVIEDSDVNSAADWSTFRSVLGLSGYSTGSFTQVHPSGDYTCSDPQATGDAGEAIIDAEWASAAAPGAAIELVSCANSGTTSGLFFALENLVNGTSPPPIMSISYAGCEADEGVSAEESVSSLYQQAVTEGMSVFVAAGDWGAAVCDAGSGSAYATQGIGVNGLASTAYNVAVGGTDFGETYAGTTSTYWSSSNGSTYGSAKSYIPEIPWNSSCASGLIASYEGTATTYGSSGFCNSSTATMYFIDFYAGSGGPSSCAVASDGGCAGTPKPSWQSAPGVPADGVRDLPDVSLFAAITVGYEDTIWGHAYVFCDSGDSTCTTASSPSSWATGGGTSFASPILAGIQALVNQSTGARQGNPNTVYYTLASSQSASGLGCNSSSGNAVSSGCVFYDVTMGDDDVVCQGSSNCYLPSGTYGVLSTSDSSYAPAYHAATGWDFATGLGSVNAANLVKYWTSSDISLAAGGSVTAGGQLSYTLKVGDRGPQGSTGVVVTTVLPAGFTLIAAMSSSGCSQSGQTVTCTVGALAVGGSVTLTVVIEPGAAQSVNLTFSASSSNADLDPADGSATVALNWSGGESAGSDGPLPLWAYAALALMLLAVAARRSGRRPATASKS